jgi:hypothetical protein
LYTTPVTVLANSPKQNTFAIHLSSMVMFGLCVALYAAPG